MMPSSTGSLQLIVNRKVLGLRDRLGPLRDFFALDLFVFYN